MYPCSSLLEQPPRIKYGVSCLTARGLSGRNYQTDLSVSIVLKRPSLVRNKPSGGFFIDAKNVLILPTDRRKRQCESVRDVFTGGFGEQNKNTEIYGHPRYKQ